MQTRPRPQNMTDAFNNVWQHFIVERHPASARPYSADDTRVGYYQCLYRTPDGENGCAVGCQIPDNSPLLDGLLQLNPSIAIPRSTSEQLVADVVAYLNCPRRFVSDLQRAHDGAVNEAHAYDGDFYVELEQRLRNLAQEWNIPTPDSSVQ